MIKNAIQLRKVQKRNDKKESFYKSHIPIIIIEH